MQSDVGNSILSDQTRTTKTAAVAYIKVLFLRLFTKNFRRQLTNQGLCM
jgi:hypothetical protein